MLLLTEENSTSEAGRYKIISPSFSWAVPHSTRYGSSAADRPQIQLIRWPGNSPHLNPSETVWAWMKKQLKDHKYTSMEQWKAAILLVWLQRTQKVDFLKNLVVGMLTRMQEVIAGEGGMTRY
jgi:transposase